MDTTEGQKKVLMVAKERGNNTKDMYQSKAIKDVEDREREIGRERVGGRFKHIAEMEGVLP